MKSPIDQMSHVQRHIKEVRGMFKDHKPAYVPPSKHYDGKELRPFTGRPGSMDAFSLPSRTGDEYRPYVGPRPQCVGAAGPAPFTYSRSGME